MKNKPKQKVSKIIDVSSVIRDALGEALSPLQTAVRKSTLGAPAVLLNRGESKGISFAKYLRGAVYGDWSDADAEKDTYVELQKVLNGVVGTAGGFLVPEDFVNEVIELLRAKSVIRGMGATVYQVKGDTLLMPRQTGGATATWIEYDESKSESEGTFGEFKLVLKECAAYTRVKNSLLEDAAPAVDTIVKNDLSSALALSEDLAFIAGTGGSQPLGLLNDPGVGSTILGAGNGATPTFDDMMDALYAIEAANGTFTGWVMHPRTKNTLRKIKDANGRYIYHLGDLTKREPDQMLGLPVGLTTQVPIARTCGANTDCSAIFLANWAQYAIAQKSGAQIKLDVSQEAGNSFVYNETWFRASLRVDGGAKQANEFYVIDGVRP